jgi:hypothetical protein
MKPYLHALVLVLATVSSGASYAQTEFGGSDCGQWVANPSNVRKAWVMGHLSGMNAIHVIWGEKPTDPLDKLSSIDQADLWITNYCKANPLRKLSSATYMLFVELKKQ